MTRRDFAGRIAAAAASSGILSEFAFAQRASVNLGGIAPQDMVWLNANENPAGPPPSVVRAMTDVISSSNRYHYQEFADFYAKVAASEQLSADQILVGAGSSEPLQAAVEAFTSPARPMIAIQPTYEAPPEVARALGRKVVQVPLTDGYYADVKNLAAEADKAGGGLIYLCNPNNPTSALTPRADIEWLASHLPKNTIALIDEAYIHFAHSPEDASALHLVRQGKNVIVTRTFSKIYGMAGMRAGFACGRPDLIAQMSPFRNNVISIVTARGVLAALAESHTLLPERKAKLGKTRGELCAWLKGKNLKYIEPQANFVMIDVGRDVREIGSAMAKRGVAVGRPFPPLNHLLRVTIGTEEDMAKFREVFTDVYKA